MALFPERHTFEEERNAPEPGRSGGPVRDDQTGTFRRAMQPELSVNLITVLVVAMLAVLVLVGVGSMVVPGLFNRLRQAWTLLTPPPM
jgi:hypothetical protein